MEGEWGDSYLIEDLKSLSAVPMVWSACSEVLRWGAGNRGCNHS